MMVASISIISAKISSVVKHKLIFIKRRKFQEFPLKYSYQNILHPMVQRAHARILPVAYSVYYIFQFYTQELEKQLE